MRIAVTGGRGRIGRAITAEALARGHDVVNIDRIGPDEAAPEGGERPPLPQGDVRYLTADTSDYDDLLATFEGCDAMIHMAAIPSPFRHPDHVVHNNNVTGSYNALRAAVEHGIMRICQASSVNAIGLSFSRESHFDYFPLDEDHRPYNEEPYGLSKWICEAQADSFARRYEGIRIASLRFHLVTPNRETAGEHFNVDTPGIAKHLWAYTRTDAAVDACLLSLDADFTGHEVFYVVAPDTTLDVPTEELAAKHFAGVPIRGDISGCRSFFSSAKANRMLGWTHKPGR